MYRGTDFVLTSLQVAIPIPNQIHSLLFGTKSRYSKALHVGNAEVSGQQAGTWQENGARETRLRFGGLLAPSPIVLEILGGSVAWLTFFTMAEEALQIQPLIRQKILIAGFVPIRFLRI